MDNDQLPNLDPNKAGGGPAIKTKPPTLKDRLVNLTRGDAGDQKPTIKQGLGSFLQSKVKDISKNIVEKLVSKGVKKSVLMFILANLPTILVITAFLVIAVALTNSALKGRYGRTATQAASVYDSSVMGDIRVVLGDQIMVTGNPQANYFSQGDPNFNKEPLKGKWPASGRNMLKEAGCAITASAMMIRYYGVTNVSPVQFANDMAQGGSLNLKRDFMTHYLPDKKVVEISKNMETVTKFIKNGDPVLAYGNPICGSKSIHYVLIIGVSKDGQNFIISDPAGDKPRQSAARFCSKNDLLGHIKYLRALQ